MQLWCSPFFNFISSLQSLHTMLNGPVRFLAIGLETIKLAFCKKELFPVTGKFYRKSFLINKTTFILYFGKLMFIEEPILVSTISYLAFVLIQNEEKQCILEKLIYSFAEQLIRLSKVTAFHQRISWNNRHIDIRPNVYNVYV